MPDVIAFEYESRLHKKVPGAENSMLVTGVYMPEHNSTVTREISGSLGTHYKVTAGKTTGSFKRELEEMTQRNGEDRPKMRDESVERTYYLAQQVRMPSRGGTLGRKAITRLERDLSRGEYQKKVEARQTIDRMIEETRARIEQNAAASQ